MTTQTESPVTTGPITVNRDAVHATFRDPDYDRPMPDLGDAERVVVNLVHHDAEDHGWLDLPDLWQILVYCETDDSNPPVLLVVVDTHMRLPSGGTRRFASPSFDWDEPFPTDVSQRICENGWHPTELDADETIEVLEFLVRLANEAVAL